MDFDERKEQRKEEEKQLIIQATSVERFRGKLPGSWLYFFRGYLYTMDGRRRRRQLLPRILRCSNSAKYGCREIIKIEKDSDVVLDPDKALAHICDVPNYNYRRVHKFRDELCRQARETFQPLREIFDNTGSDEGE